MPVRNIIILLAFLAPGRLAAQDQPGKINLAVQDFTAAQADLPLMMPQLTEKLRFDLLATGKVWTLKRSQMDAVFQEKGYQPTADCLSDSCAAEMGRVLGAVHVLTGSLSRSGFGYYINLKVINARSGRIEKNTTADCDVRYEDIAGCLKNTVTNLLFITSENTAGPKVSVAVTEPDEPKSSGSVFKAGLGVMALDAGEWKKEIGWDSLGLGSAYHVEAGAVTSLLPSLELNYFLGADFASWDTAAPAHDQDNNPLGSRDYSYLFWGVHVGVGAAVKFPLPISSMRSFVYLGADAVPAFMFYLPPGPSADGSSAFSLTGNIKLGGVVYIKKNLGLDLAVRWNVGSVTMENDAVTDIPYAFAPDKVSTYTTDHYTFEMGLGNLGVDLGVRFGGK